MYSNFLLILLRVTLIFLVVPVGFSLMLFGHSDTLDKYTVKSRLVFILVVVVISELYGVIATYLGVGVVELIRHGFIVTILVGILLWLWKFTKKPEYSNEYNVESDSNGTIEEVEEYHNKGV